jgi:hypothetical protein
MTIRSHPFAVSVNINTIHSDSPSSNLTHPDGLRRKKKKQLATNNEDQMLQQALGEPQIH